jgi:hypothetical protein
LFDMRRRNFITLLGGAAAAWPLAVRAQQAATPVIGFLGIAPPDTIADRLRAFRNGLKGIGYIEGENAAIIYRWTESPNDRLPELAAELVRRPVGVIVAIANTVSAAKEATTTIPHSFHRHRRPGQAWSCAQPSASGRQPNRRQYLQRRAGGEAAGVLARNSVRSQSRGCA